MIVETGRYNEGVALPLQKMTDISSARVSRSDWSFHGLIKSVGMTNG